MTRARSVSMTDRYRLLVEPREDGLPRVSLLLAFPALLLLVGVVLVAIGINGSSSGALWAEVSAGPDPDLLAGEPQQIRSDEWNVGTVWTIAQVQQGLPARTETFPGGMDAAIPFDLPRSDWSIAFRPHQIGYLLLDVDHGTAWRWWSMGLALMAAAYAFVLTILPRRPLVAAALSLGFFCSPFFQWWYQSSTFWPVVWGLVVMAALVWSVKSSDRLKSWVWAPVVAYFTVVTAMGIYAPFIIPVVLVVLGFGIGLLIERMRDGQSARDLALRLAPVLTAGVVGGAVTAVWLASKHSTVAGFLGTVYPGARLTGTGTGGSYSAARTVASAFTESLTNAGGFLGINSSEASTFILTGAFLLPVGVWLVVVARRSRSHLPWTAIAVAVVLAVFVAYTLVPGWDSLAHVLMLDRTTPDRARIGVGLASFVLLALLLRRLDEAERRVPRWLAGLCAVLFIGSQCAIAIAVVSVMGEARLWGATPLWWLYALASAAVIYLNARRQVVAATTVFLLVSVAAAAGINPVYLGVLDLRDTAASQAVMRIDASGSGTWIGMGKTVAAATLLESGVEAYNGTQGAPSARMWSEIDPVGQYEAQWNRIGKVWWAPGAGEPVVSNPAPDQIQISFDACSDFAQQNVTHVLSSDAVSSPCLQSVETIDDAAVPLTIYEVDAP